MWKAFLLTLVQEFGPAALEAIKRWLDGPASAPAGAAAAPADVPPEVAEVAARLEARFGGE